MKAYFEFQILLWLPLLPYGAWKLLGVWPCIWTFLIHFPCMCTLPPKSEHLCRDFVTKIDHVCPPSCFFCHRDSCCVFMTHRDLRNQTLEVGIQSLDVFFPVQHGRPCDLPVFSFLFKDALVKSRCNSKASGSTWRCFSFDQDPQQAMRGGLLQSSAPCYDYFGLNEVIDVDSGNKSHGVTWWYICNTLTILKIIQVLLVETQVSVHMSCIDISMRYIYIRA